jgi:hypothetical protein
VSDVRIPQEIWDHEISARPAAATEWLWQGLVAPGNLTLLTSQWKAGKTTLLSLLLSRRKEGGTLAGLAVRPGKSVVVSEEPEALWRQRAEQYGFGGQVCFFLRPFLTIPRPEEWRALVGRLLALRERHQIDLAVIDPLAPYLACENNARSVLEALLPLGGLTRAGMAALLLHHPGRGSRPVGQGARGSGALLGHVDISIEMRHPGGDPFTRRRRFLSLSRHAETPRQLLLELNPEGTEYLPVPDAPEGDGQAYWEPLRVVLEDAPQKLSRQDVLAEWPPDFERPNAATLWRWLDRAVRSGLVAREGTGRKADPFRYWLPEREAVWKQDPLYDLLEEQRRMLNLPFESLQERKKKLSEGGQALPEE